ncbi:MAG: sigma-E processing peptidase SpoIIGA [Clostridia bacterium]|nr:sigma-E processing peptidase SpoIIGA [Clostridia bacterium]
MDIYIEYAIIDNLLLDYILFLATSLTLKMNRKISRLLLCSAIATIVAIIIPILCQSLPTILIAVIKLICAPLLCLPLCYKDRMSRYVWSIMIFVAYTILLGGTIYAIMLFTNNYMPSSVALTYSASVPIGVYLLAMLLFGYLVANIVKYIISVRHIAKFEYTATFSIMHKQFSVQSFLDSGNTLMYRDKAVCFVLDRQLCKRLGALISQGIATNQLKLEYVPFSTVAGKGATVAIQVDDFTICGATSTIYLALSKGENRGYSIMINSYLLPQGEPV